jgi:CRISPR-associated exonuclease Cas4
MTHSGSLVHTFVLCPRKTWLLLRQICGDQENDFLAIGRLLSKSSYKREKKEITIGKNKIDVMRFNNEEIIAIEIKKSSKMLKTSRIQLLHYLYCLKKLGYFVRGEIRIPKEKKVILVTLENNEIKELEDIYKNIDRLIETEKPVKPRWIEACKTCSYLEFCWA